MGSYKVPQDVEADDKLIGPFSFRQFIYLLIAFGGAGMAWGLSTIFIPLAVIPLPVIILFGALALPLKKDQPMEIYLAAVLSFFIKPRKRLWRPDGRESLIEITSPKTVAVNRTKGLSEGEAARRLSYLADLVDSEGWAIRGVDNPDVNNSMINDVFYEAQQADDILDDQNSVARSFDQKIQATSARHRQDLLTQIRQTAAQPAPLTAPSPQPSTASSPTSQQQEAVLEYNPYPGSIKQSVITPEGNRVADYTKKAQEYAASLTPASALYQSQPPTSSQPPQQTVATPPVSASEKPLSPDIMKLATNSDLSIQTIAREADRISKKQQANDGEVVISLR